MLPSGRSVLLKFVRKSSKRTTIRHVKYATVAHNLADERNRISAWQIHSYGGLEELQQTKARSPIIRQPNDVIIDVHAASVNPIDVAMSGGYGSTLLNILRQTETCSLSSELEFPLTLGRDFSGIIVDHGFTNSHDFKVGDEVWGVVPPHRPGCHAEQLVVNRNFIERKPKNLNMVEAGSLLYAALTAWSALKITGGLALLPTHNKKVLVLGGSGGVGTMAIQLLKAWGSNVVTTCSTSAIPYVQSLGILDIVDYTKDDVDEQIQAYGKYDIVLDCAGLGFDNTQKYNKYLKESIFSKTITLSSPFLKNMDESGIIGGMLKNLTHIAHANSGLFTRGTSYRWAFFVPYKGAITEITQLVERGKLVPRVDTVYKFQDAPEAYAKVKSGHLRGKVVIDIKN